MINDNLPKVIPEVVREGSEWLFRVKCPYYSEIHTHGAGRDKKPSAYGHRIGHCGKLNDGYIIIPNPDKS